MTIHDIIAIVAGWAIPIVLTYLFSKMRWVTERPYILAAIIGATFAIGASYTIVILLNPLKNTVAFAPQVGKCPDGFADQGEIILIRQKKRAGIFYKSAQLSTHWDLLKRSKPDE